MKLFSHIILLALFAISFTSAIGRERRTLADREELKARAASRRVSVAPPEAGGAEHRNGGMNDRKRRRRAAEQRRVQAQALYKK
mmetsp:Transcript_5411/g.8543  ORF Transcript_5411/g.8543 Transcript_5411/m.8543 type:complete len:84 (-) Transcript_5411:262-513(-)